MKSHRIKSQSVFKQKHISYMEYHTLVATTGTLLQWYKDLYQGQGIKYIGLNEIYTQFPLAETE